MLAMLCVVLISTLLVQGIFANPLSDSNYPEAIAVSRTFDLQDTYWNPTNWFGGSSEKENAVKFEALYKVLECVTANDPKECSKFIDEAKKHFVKDEKTPTNKI